MNFKRGEKPATSLDIGQVKIYGDMWDERMPEYYDQINEWAKEHGIDHTYARLDKKTGIFTFYKIDFSQELKPVYSISLEELIDSFDKRKEYAANKMMQELEFMRAKQKAEMEMMKHQQEIMLASMGVPKYLLGKKKDGV